MKRCPACRKVLPDDKMLLCPYDGTPLFDTVANPNAFTETVRTESEDSGQALDPSLEKAASGLAGFRWWSRISQYREWKHPSGLTESVKLGWSWPAFLFGGLWAIAKRMTLVGICMLLGSIAIGCAIVLTQGEDEDFVLTAASLLLGLFFGANGNSWRERHLRRRGFVPGDLEEKPVLISVRTLLAHPIVGLRALWKDKVLSGVIAGLVVAAIVGGVAYVLRSRSAADLADSTNIAPQHFSAQSCSSATMNGHVEPNGAETFVWFEWGETPDLGNVTRQQSFTDETAYYQTLVDLKENTTYFYATIALNSNGRSEGRVNSFTTARCER